MEIQVISQDQVKNPLTVSEVIFGSAFNEALIHQVITAFQAGGRAGTRAQKTRAEVRGGGIKPWKQKGTGRARAGTIRSPLWRKGGVIFAAKPRCYAQKVNRKMYKGAIRSILSELLRQDRLSVVAGLSVAEPKTKAFLNLLKDLNLPAKKLLIITDELDENLYLAARNVPTIDIRDTVGIDPVCLAGAEKVIVTVKAMQVLEEILG